jgi:hypothetical protein
MKLISKFEMFTIVNSNEHMDVKLMTLWSCLDEWNLYKKSETHGILIGPLSIIEQRKIWMKVTIRMNMRNSPKVLSTYIKTLQMKFDNLETNDIWHGWNYTHGLYRKMKTHPDDMDENRTHGTNHETRKMAWMN